LMNHPEISLAMHLPHASMQPALHRAWGQSALRFSSHVERCPENDMFLLALSKGSWHPLGRRIGGLGVVVNKSFSQGSVTLRSADPQEAPQVDFNLLSDVRDFERLVSGLKLCCEILSGPRVAGVCNEVFLPNARIVKALGKRNPWNWLRAAAVSMLFDVPGGLRSCLLGSSRVDIRGLMQDDAALRRLVTERAQPVHHVCGTCRMGRVNSDDAVVDADCGVQGVEGLRVIDASIMPTMVTANTHVPVLMIAEKMADRLK
jgi:5-(hydroxymethyl)furfural/furfural oxidase